MMHQQRSHLPITTLIILGIAAGVGYFLYDNLPQTQQATSSPAVTQTAIIAPTPAEALSSTATPATPRTAALFLPTAGTYAPVVEVFMIDGTWDVSRLGVQVGHLQGTSWFDEPGNVELSGHVELADGRAGVFADLHSVQLSDPIIVESDGQQTHYVVTAITETSADDLSPVRASDDDRLTLITCSGYDFLQDDYPLRIIVVAQRVQQP